MNFSSSLLPSRSVLQLGLRGFCHTSSRTTFGAGPPRFLAICLRISQRNYSSRAAQQSWPGIPSHQSPSVAPSYKNRRSFTSRDILSQYEDLPPDYQDKQGLPFRKTDLETPEVLAIFGTGIGTVAANQLLKILHGRRVAGTLDDPAFFINTSKFTAEQKSKALEYLRKTVPADEIVNAGLRAEDELKELEQQLSNDEETNGDEPKAVYKPDPVYGHSVIEAIRAKNEAEWEEELKRREEEKKQVDVAQPGTLMANPQRPRELSPRMQKWIENAGSKLEQPPEMTHIDRLLPSATVVVLFVGLCVAFAMVYKPPNITDRMFPEISASHATVGALIALNVLVWGLWRIPPFWGFMNKYFVLVHGLPRAVSVVTSSFSHSSITHLVSNMVGLWLFGTFLHDEIGRGNFLAIYLASGAIGMLGSLSILTLRGMLTHSTLGASGAVYGITTSYFWMHRFDSFKILGLPPEPRDGPQGLAFLGLILALHITLLFVKKTITIDLWSHLTGMATGLVGVEWVQRRNMGKTEEIDGKTKVVKLVSVAEPTIEVIEK